MIGAPYRSRTLPSILKALAKAGGTEQALQMAIEVSQDSRMIADTFRYSPEMVSVVEALAEAGEIEQALQVMRMIYVPTYLSQALPSILKALAKADKTKQAQQMAIEALYDARRIEAASSRSDVLVSIVEALATGRETVDQARTIIEAAQQAAKQITKEYEKSAALAKVATGLAKLHLYRQARELVDNNNTSAADKLTAYTAILREYHLERHPDQAQLFAELPPKED